MLAHLHVYTKLGFYLHPIILHLPTVRTYLGRKQIDPYLLDAYEVFRHLCNWSHYCYLQINNDSFACNAGFSSINQPRVLFATD